MAAWSDEDNRSRIARDLGLFLQAVAALELALDDLVSLAEDRLKISRYLANGAYPVSMGKKIEALRIISRRVGYTELPMGTELSIPQVLDARNWIAHGKVVAVLPDQSGYEIRVAKQGKVPRRVDGVQTIVRNHKNLKRSDFASFANAIRRVKFDVSAVSAKVFPLGDGWPNYIAVPEGDPLGVDDFYKVMA